MLGNARLPSLRDKQEEEAKLKEELARKEAKKIKVERKKPTLKGKKK